MERLISKSSRYFGQYETTTTDWLALDNDMFKITEITHARFIVANIYYGLFGKLIEGLSQFKGIETPVFESPPPTKVVETPASSSLANGFCSRFFGFIKCLPYLKATQAPLSSLVCRVPCSSHSGFVKKLSPFIDIKGPPQLLVDRVVCPLFFIVGFTGNGNGKQFQFNCIL